VKKNLVLLGMMGVGKSTLGKIVAKKLNLKFVDTDSNIEKNCSMKISEIFKNKGEEFFRLKEEKEVLECLKKNKTVIAVGGGAFVNKNIRSSILKNSLSFWLDLDLKKINKRVKWNKKRPLVNSENGEEIIKKLYSERKNIYKLAKYRINCNKMTKEKIVEKIIFFYENYKIKR
jgi:shikimate kinase